MLVCHGSQKILGNPLPLRTHAQTMLSQLSERGYLSLTVCFSFSVHHENTLKSMKLKTKAK